MYCSNQIILSNIHHLKMEETIPPPPSSKKLPSFQSPSPLLLKKPLLSPLLKSSHPSLIENILFLDSFNIDISSSSLHRIIGMCPEILTAGDLSGVLSFLLREAGVPSGDLPHLIHRRPRLLVSSVSLRLRPTLHFLQKLGISAPHLLSFSVEEKLIPRLEFLEKKGFKRKDVRGMVRRFPQMFCYGMEGNLGRKLEFLRGVMGREIGEIREFPQYFSFSLERRIEPRWWVCREKGVFFELPALLRPSDEEFRRRLDVCVGSTSPLRKSALWKEGFSDDDCL